MPVLMGRFEEARRKIEAMVQDAGVDATPDTLIAVDKAIKEQLDYAFGASRSRRYSLAACPAWRCARMANWYWKRLWKRSFPSFEDATGKAVAASNARKAQRLERYRDKRVGLAPGQQT